MKIITGNNVKEALEMGYIIYSADSDSFEKRYYKMESDCIKYRDIDNLEWKTSKLDIEDIKKQSWVVLK